MLNNFLVKLHRFLGQQCARLDWSGGNIFLILDSEADIQRTFSCKKEPETVSWLTNTLRAEDVFYDVGANVGAYSLIGAHLLKSGKILSFEPGFANFATLSKNIIKNSFQEKIIPIQVALSDKNGFTTMHFSTLESGGAKHALIRESLPTSNSLTIQTQSLDDFIEKYGAPAPTLMKIDVDGGEWDVVQGGRRTLLSPSLRSLLIEIDFKEPNAKALVEYIESTGLRLVEKYPREKGKSTHLFNMIFSRENL